MRNGQMTIPAKTHQVFQGVGLFVSHPSKYPKGDNVVNIQLLAKQSFIDSAVLTSVLVAPSRLPPLHQPVGTIIRIISASPHWIIGTRQIAGSLLPRLATFRSAKVQGFQEGREAEYGCVAMAALYLDTVLVLDMGYTARTMQHTPSDQARPRTKSIGKVPSLPGPNDPLTTGCTFSPNPLIAGLVPAPSRTKCLVCVILWSKKTCATMLAYTLRPGASTPVCADARAKPRHSIVAFFHRVAAKFAWCHVRYHTITGTVLQGESAQ